jgi:cell division protein FtsW (lipid II flippase)
MFLIYAALGIIITLAANADIRYKYPFMFIVFIYNSFFITGLLKDYIKKGRAVNPPV